MIIFIYFLTDGKSIKIGCSAHPYNRKVQLNTGNAKKLRLITYISGNKDREKEIHNKFKKYNIHLEWFTPSDELLEYINKLSHDTYAEVVNKEIQIYKKMKKI